MFSVLPKYAEIKSTSYFFNLSVMFFVAELLLETTATLSSRITAFAIIFKIVCVFPVPGGPSIIDKLLSNALSIAYFWLILKPNGNIVNSFSSFLIGFIILKNAPMQFSCFFSLTGSSPFKKLYNIVSGTTFFIIL